MLLLLLAIVAQVPGQPLPPPTPATGVIAGRVVDGITGQPITGAIVTLVHRPGPGAPPQQGVTSGVTGGAASRPRSVIVDVSGRYVFAGLPAGTYDVTSAKRGYTDGAFGRLRLDGGSQPIVLASQERRSDADLRVWKYSSIAGTLVDEAGEPMVGIEVFALRREWIAGALRFNRGGAATTDDRGAFRIRQLRDGAYLVVVPSVQSTVPASMLDVATAGTAGADDVRTAVSLAAPRPQPLGNRDTQRVGEFVLHGSSLGIVSPGPAADGRLLVYPMAFSPSLDAGAAQLHSLAFGESRSIAPIQLRLTSAVRVSGIVAGGSAAAHTALRLIPAALESFATEYGFAGAQTVADATGAFTFLGVTPGTYRLRGAKVVAPAPPPGAGAADRPSRPPTSWLNEEITVGNEDLALAVSLRPEIKISGRVIFEGQRTPPANPLPTDLIRVYAADGRTTSTISGRLSHTTPSTFQLSELAGGRYVLRQNGSPTGWSLKSITIRGQDAIDVPFELAADLTDVVLTFTDRTSTLTGVVRTSSGSPDADALVIAFPTEPQRWSQSGPYPLRIRSVRPSRAGAFTFTNLPPGDYLLAAVHDGAASDWQSPQFLELLSRQTVRVRVAEGVNVTHDLKRVEVK